MGEQGTAEGKARLTGASLQMFVAESNRIEGIGEVRGGDVPAHILFLSRSQPTVDDLEGFVAAVALADLRHTRGMDVRVGGHFPPPGGPHIITQLEALLADVQTDTLTPYQAHCRYELLHPFMDGNGRSGRALWAWQMLRAGQDPFALPFLHRFYYQALDAARKPAEGTEADIPSQSAVRERGS